MKRMRLGMAMVGLLGLAGGGVPVADAQSEYNQCYRRPEMDEPGACTACYNICLGAGYVCCKITPITSNTTG
jgi:hypothetical protein